MKSAAQIDPPHNIEGRAPPMAERVKKRKMLNRLTLTRNEGMYGGRLIFKQCFLKPSAPIIFTEPVHLFELIIF